MLPAPETLELRIHGIKNTTPASMLGVAPKKVERVDGDDLGAFWIEQEPPPDRRERREAYSWGGMTRSGGGPLALIGTLFVHLGWVLILPFGLCNVAYWTRRIPLNQEPGRWDGGRGAPVLRLFALGLTLIYVTALASVSLDLIGVQCFPLSDSLGRTVCSQLPPFFDALSDLTRGVRLALLSLVPLAIMLLLYALSHRARVRYEPNIAKLAKPAEADEETPVAPAVAATAIFEASAAAARPPLLASAEFWVQARIAATTERLHFSAVVFFLVTLLAGDRLFAGNLELRGYAANPSLQSGLLALPVAIATSPIAFACLVVAAAGLLWVGILICITSETNPDRLLRRRRISGWVLALSGAVFLVVGISSGFDPDPAAQPLDPLPTLLGLEAAPTLLVGILLGLSVAALGWRRGVPIWLSIVIMTGALVCLVFGRAASVSATATPVISAIAADAVPYYLGAALLLAVELVIVLVFPIGAGRAKRHADFAYEGWRGMGPGVVMLLALGVAMALASLVVVGFAAFLAMPLAGKLLRDDMFRAAPPPSPLIVPPAYVEFGVALLGMLVVALLFAAVILVPLVTRLFRLSTPVLKRDGVTPDERVKFSPLPGYGNDRPPIPQTFDRLEQRILKARRIAALAQRGEPFVGILAAIVGVGLVATVILRVPSDFTTTVVTIPAQSIAVGMLSAIALAAFTAVAANALTNTERPMGVLWDVICFLPRAGHPFGPPCYSDRVVPELNSRVRKWLEATDTASKRRRVVLSAHSLGAVLAVSTIFANVSSGSTGAQPCVVGSKVPPPRIGLLTYGTQLRAYFGRFLPELLGPEVLGTRPCQAPRLFGGDPWLRQVLDDEQERGRPAPDGPGTLRAILTPTTRRCRPAQPLWINVWRRTDYLGFPVNSYRGRANEIDRGAGELEPTTYLVTVASHGNYPDTAEYTGAVHDLLGRMMPPRHWPH